MRKYTAPLIFAIGNATTDIKNSINTQDHSNGYLFCGSWYRSCSNL